MEQALTIRVRHERGHAIVSVAGEIDIATVARLRGPPLARPATGD